MTKPLTKIDPNVLWEKTTQQVRSNMFRASDKTSYHDGCWDSARVVKQQALISQLVKTAQHFPCEGKSLFVGGMPGSGKSTLLSTVIDPRRYFVIDPDVIKEEMIKCQMVPTIENLTPLEAGPLVHYESTQLAKELLFRLVKKKVNIVYPMTFSVSEAVSSRAQTCKDAGYSTVNAIFVKVTKNTSTRRVKERHYAGVVNYLHHGKGLGGRFIDLANVERQESTAIFQQCCSFFGSARILDNEFDLI